MMKQLVLLAVLITGCVTTNLIEAGKDFPSKYTAMLGKIDLVAKADSLVCNKGEQRIFYAIKNTTTKNISVTSVVTNSSDAIADLIINGSPQKYATIKHGETKKILLRFDAKNKENSTFQRSVTINYVFAGEQEQHRHVSNFRFTVRD
jgi:hypothetical protein